MKAAFAAAAELVQGSEWERGEVLRLFARRELSADTKAGALRRKLAISGRLLGTASRWETGALDANPVLMLIMQTSWIYSAWLALLQALPTPQRVTHPGRAACCPRSARQRGSTVSPAQPATGARTWANPDCDYDSTYMYMYMYM